MTNIIDELVVKLRLDRTEFEKGAREADRANRKVLESSKKAGTEIESSGKQAATAIKGLTREVMTLFAVFTAGRGVKEFVGDMTNANTALGKLSFTLKTSPQVISSWGLAIEQLGGSGDAAARSFQNFSNSIQELRTTGNTGMLPWLYKLQAAGGHTINLGKNLNSVFLDLSRNLSAVARRDPAMANFLGQRLGLDPDTIQLLMKGPAAVQEALRNASRNAINEKDVKAAQALTKSWTELMQTSKRFGATILTELSPSMQKIIGDTQKWTDANRNMISKEVLKSVEDFNKSISMTASLLGKIYDWINKVDAAFGVSKFLNWMAGLPNPGESGKPGSKPGFTGWIERQLDKIRPSGRHEDLMRKGGSPYGGLDESVRSGGAPRPPGGSSAPGAGGAIPPSQSMGGHTGGWWTPERQKYAIGYLMKHAGLSEYGAAGLVARWAGVEAKGGPGSRNPFNGAEGIGQWLGTRKRAGVTNRPDFDGQLAHAAWELNHTETKAAAALRAARNPWEGARGASMYERAEGYNARTGLDNWTTRTPSNAVHRAWAANREGGGGPGFIGSAQAAGSKSPGSLGLPRRDTFGFGPFGAPYAASSSMQPISRSTSNKMDIGTITINTRATDASGIARDMSDALNENSFASMAQTGVD